MRKIKKDSYYAHVFAVQLGEPGVVRNGCHDHRQVPEMETHTYTHRRTQKHTHIRDKIQIFKLANSICSKPFDVIDP